VITVTVIVALLRILAETLLNLGGIPYLSTATLPLIEKSAWVLIPLLILVFILFYVAYFQYAVILFGARDIRNDEYSLLGTLGKAFKSTVHASPLSILLLAVNMIMILPIAGAMFPTDVFSNLQLPYYFYELMTSRWYLAILLSIYFIGFYWLAFRYYLVLPLTILKGYPVTKAFSVSASMMKGHKRKTLIQLVVLSLLFFCTELLVFAPMWPIQRLADSLGDMPALITCAVLLAILKLFAAYYSIRISIIMFFTTYPEDMFAEESISETSEKEKSRKKTNKVLGILSGIGTVLMALVYSLWFIVSYNYNIPMVISNGGSDGNNGVPNTIEVMEDTVRSAHPDYVSVTVQHTKDDRYVVIGPDDLFRYCGVNGSVSDYTLDEITAMAAVNGKFRSGYSSLDDYLAAASKAGQPLILELSASSFSEDSVDRFLDTYGIQIFLEGHILQSSDYSIVKRLLEINKELTDATGTAAITYKVSCTLYNSLLYPAVNVDSFAVDDTNLQQMFVNKGKIYHQNIYVWNVDDEALMDKMILMNVDGIYTNYPSLLRKRIYELEDSGYTQVILKFIYKYYKY